MRPRLYIDIDGVIYGHYGGQWQIRPYVVTLTRWAQEYFDIYWVSFNSNRINVVNVIYAGGAVLTKWFDGVDEDWHPLSMQSEKLHAIHKTGGLKGEWFLIEDTPPTKVQQQILEEYGASHRWLVVPDTGSDVLLDVKSVLENYGNTGNLYVPYEWATRELSERDLWANAEWKGYGKSGRNQ